MAYLHNEDINNFYKKEMCQSAIPEAIATYIIVVAAFFIHNMFNLPVTWRPIKDGRVQSKDGLRMVEFNLMMAEFNLIICMSKRSEHLPSPYWQLKYSDITCMRLLGLHMLPLVMSFYTPCHLVKSYVTPACRSCGEKV